MPHSSGSLQASLVSRLCGHGHATPSITTVATHHGFAGFFSQLNTVAQSLLDQDEGADAFLHETLAFARHRGIARERVQRLARDAAHFLSVYVSNRMGPFDRFPWSVGVLLDDDERLRVAYARALVTAERNGWFGRAGTAERELAISISPAELAPPPMRAAAGSAAAAKAPVGAAAAAADGGGGAAGAAAQGDLGGLR